MADAGQHILEHPPPLIVVMHLIGRQQRNPAGAADGFNPGNRSVIRWNIQARNRQRQSLPKNIFERSRNRADGGQISLAEFRIDGLS